MPQAPQNLNVTPGPSSNLVDWTHQDPDPDKTLDKFKFIVRCSPDAPGNWQVLDDDHEGTQFVHLGLDPDRTYWYSILAKEINGGAISAPSGMALGTTLAPPQPTNAQGGTVTHSSTPDPQTMLNTHQKKSRWGNILAFSAMALVGVFVVGLMKGWIPIPSASLVEAMPDGGTAGTGSGKPDPAPAASASATPPAGTDKPADPATPTPVTPPPAQPTPIVTPTIDADQLADALMKNLEPKLETKIGTIVTSQLVGVTGSIDELKTEMGNLKTKVEQQCGTCKKDALPPIPPNAVVPTPAPSPSTGDVVYVTKDQLDKLQGQVDRYGGVWNAYTNLKVRMTTVEGRVTAIEKDNKNLHQVLIQINNAPSTNSGASTTRPAPSAPPPGPVSVQDHTRVHTQKGGGTEATVMPAPRD